MDQDAFHKTYREINDRVCIFEKAILSRNCDCPHATKLLIAEREAMHCNLAAGHELCSEFIDHLLPHTRFSLRINDYDAALPHGKAMKLQVGGLRGLYMALHQETKAPEQIKNAYELIRQAKAQFDDLGQLPFQLLIQQVAAYQGRQRAPRKL